MASLLCSRQTGGCRTRRWCAGRRLPAGEIPVSADFAPDVAFEIHSPSDSPSQIQRKRRDYQESGVVQVWFELEKRLVEMIYPNHPLHYFDETKDW